MSFSSIESLSFNEPNRLRMVVVGVVAVVVDAEVVVVWLVSSLRSKFNSLTSLVGVFNTFESTRSFLSLSGCLELKVCFFFIQKHSVEQFFFLKNFASNVCKTFLLTIYLISIWLWLLWAIFFVDLRSDSDSDSDLHPFVFVSLS